MVIMLLISISGCLPHKKLVNYRDNGLEESTSVAYVKPKKLKIQPNDVLSITVYDMVIIRKLLLLIILLPVVLTITGQKPFNYLVIWRMSKVILTFRFWVGYFLED